MDYDKSDIASVYDEARGLAPETLRQWLSALSARLAGRVVSRIVDLGCGTGRFTEPLAEHFSARVIGIDPSQKMLGQARRKPRSDRVVFERASAERLPITDNSVDMVFMSMAFHPAAVAEECKRVLRDTGYIFVRNSTREADFPVRHFFPTMQPLIESALPTRSDLRRVFETAGLTTAAHEIVRQAVASNGREFVQKSSLRADSFLARLSDADYKAGMTNLGPTRRPSISMSRSSKRSICLYSRSNPGRSDSLRLVLAANSQGCCGYPTGQGPARRPSLQSVET